MTAVRPALIFALLVLLAVAACSGETEETCPGAEVGAFRIEVAIPDDVVTPPFCSLALPEPPDTRVVRTFDASITVEGSSPGTRPAALCVERALASPYYGSRDASGTFTLGTTSGIAVLENCGANCSATVMETLTGTISDDGTGPRFTGALVERFDVRSGDCGTCLLPCTATYTLTTVR